MKTLKITIVICSVSLLFVACKDEKTQIAKDNVEEYTSYVDSVTNLDLAMAETNWNKIENSYNNYKEVATENVDNISDSEVLKQKIDDATIEYETYKTELIAEKEQEEMLVNKNNFRTAILGQNYTDNDMSFEWINKDNILGVYQTFVHTVEMNKDTYSREDWDEIKLLYEAIDTRKNTVEKEGLTSSDNRQIASLKLKFAPMYTLNRMGTKSEENANAKK